ncbi:hypothetical protein BRC99_06510 [Halobacteriales archaeon QS_7_69_60]|nr:MAG: hypothetical protein BRC99_06510 [Halobacteriales archaeon QS_7_69_60]
MAPARGDGRRRRRRGRRRRRRRRRRGRWRRRPGSRVALRRGARRTPRSNAKVSQLLSSMEDDDRVDKLRIGRENLISLPTEGVTDIDPGEDS